MVENEELQRFRGLAQHVVGLGLRSKAATIRRLAPDIAHYRDLGYSLSQLLDVFLQAGLAPTSLLTFKSALTRWRATAAAETARANDRPNNAVSLQRPEK
jgi:hypothetical protein